MKLSNTLASRVVQFGAREHGFSKLPNAYWNTELISVKILLFICLQDMLSFILALVSA